MTALYLLYYQDLAERQLAAAAEEQYKQGDYAAAERSYSQLAQEYSTSSEADRYRFLAELSRMQSAVRALNVRQDYTPALQQWQAFINEHKDSPWAKPGSGYGHDILEAGKKLSEDMVAYANDLLQQYRSERSQNASLETEIRRTVAAGHQLVKSLAAFRGPDDPPMDRWQQDWDRLDQELQREHTRQQILQQARQLLTTITDARIAQVERDLEAAGLLQDAEAQALLQAALHQLRMQIRYEPDPAAAQAFPTTNTRNIFCVAATTPTSAIKMADTPSTTPLVFPVIAQGIVYALQEETGNLLWAIRVGTEAVFAPTRARVTLAEGNTELVLCVLHTGTQAAIAALLLRDGTPRWYQPLPSPPAAPPVVVGSRVYVALRDEWGTICEFDVTDGSRRGRLRLGQPVGFLTYDSHSRLLYAAAEARRIFILDPGNGEDEGNLSPLRCRQILYTGHEAGTLRTAPLPLELPAIPPAPPQSCLLLCQADGAQRTKIRLFTLTPLPDPTTTVPPEARPTAQDHTLEGWVAFQPFCDGEHLAIATDDGQMRLFRLDPSGGPDRLLLPLADCSSHQQPDSLSRQQLINPSLPVPAAVIPAEEAAFIILAHERIQKFRLALHPQRGQVLVPVGPAQVLGVPTQEPLIDTFRNVACLTVRQMETATYHAVLIQLSDGAILWQRQLGLAAATAPIAQPDKTLLLARDGNILALPSTFLANSAPQLVATDEQLVASAPNQPAGSTFWATSPDLSWVATVTPILERQQARERQQDRQQLQLSICLLNNKGQRVHHGKAVAPAPVAGSPIMLGDSLLIPLADGVVYRHVPGKGVTIPDKLEPGPAWRAERQGVAQSTALLSPLDNSSFLSNDGGRRLKRWSWSLGQRWSESGEWELRERPAVPVLVLHKDGAATHLVLADITGNVWLYSADRPAAPIRRWRPGASLPLGTPTSPLVVTRDNWGRSRIVYTVENRFLVCLDPNQDAPLWVHRHSDEPAALLVGAPVPLANGDWLTIDLTGRINRLEAATGITKATARLDIAGVFPLTPPTQTTTRELLLPLSDGSFVLLPQEGVAQAHQDF
jgi:hypothetical protein